jgi:hypothetical protein
MMISHQDLASKTYDAAEKDMVNKDAESKEV